MATNIKTCIEKCQWEWQAQLIGRALSEAGIPYEIRPIPREYASVITGVVGDSFGVYVNELQAENAREIIRDAIPSHTPTPEASNSPPPAITKDYFRRTIMFSFLGLVILPVVFNILSVLSYRKLLQQQPSTARKRIALASVILGWIFCLLILAAFWMAQ